MMTGRQVTVILLSLSGAALLLYAASLTGGFTLDDQAIIARNPVIETLSPLTRYFSADWWGEQTLFKDELYRPVTLLTYGLQYAIHGPQTSGFHAINVLLYALCPIPVFFLLTRLLGRRRAAFWGAAVFTVHAVHTEAVANIVGRAEILSFLLGISVLLLHARDYRIPRVGRPGGLVLAALLFFLAAGAKESALVWLPVLVLFDICRRRDTLTATDVESGPSADSNTVLSIPAYLVYLLPAGAYLALRFQALGGPGGTASVYFPINPLAHADTAVRMMTGLKTLFYDMLLVFFPFRLSSDYSHSAISVVNTWHEPMFLLALAAHLLLLVSAVWAFRRHRPLFFAITFFYSATFLTSNIPLAIGTIFAERLLFTPSLSLAVLIGYILLPSGPDTVGPLKQDRLRWHAIGLVCVWLAASAVVTLVRVPHWKDNRTLFLHDVKVMEQSAVLQLRVAEIRRDERDFSGAEMHMLKAREILPGDPLILNNLGDLYRLTGRPVMADEILLEAIDAAEHPPWNRMPGNRYLTCYNLGLLRAGQDRPDEAVEWQRQAVAGNPAHLPSWDSLLEAGLNVAGTDDLYQWLGEAETEHPNEPVWLYYRGLISLTRNSDAEGAELYLTRALQLKPAEKRFHVAVADLYAATRRWDAAAAQYRQLRDRFILTPEQEAEIDNRIRILSSQAGNPRQ